ncbi:MAG: aminotransferase class I/II-fold pyridoxal phosphate-dependent enzyme, partial [Polyangiales bacterium]
TSGAQQAIALAIDALCPSRIAVDEETYPAALDLFRSRGIAAGGSGDAIYTMPGVDNPRGVGLRDRSALLARGLPVLADEAYSELRFDGVLERPLLADARDRVFHIGTVSKTLCPGLRVGWLVPPRAFLGQVLRFKHDVDLQAGSLSQAVLESFLSRDDFDARLARARKFYVARAKRMARALSRVPGLRFSMPEGGFAIFVETELAGDDRRLLELATEGGVSFDPGRLFRHDDRSAPIAFRLCFSNVSATEIDEGIRRLSSALQRFRAMRVAA